MLRKLDHCNSCVACAGVLTSRAMVKLAHKGAKEVRLGKKQMEDGNIQAPHCDRESMYKGLELLCKMWCVLLPPRIDLFIPCCIACMTPPTKHPK